MYLYPRPLRRCQLQLGKDLVAVLLRQRHEVLPHHLKSIVGEHHRVRSKAERQVAIRSVHQLQTHLHKWLLFRVQPIDICLTAVHIRGEREDHIKCRLIEEWLLVYRPHRRKESRVLPQHQVDIIDPKCIRLKMAHHS